MPSLIVTFNPDVQTDLSTLGYKIETETENQITPPQLFVASIAACVGVYIESFCQHRGISFDGLQILADWEIASDSPRRIGKIFIKIKLPKTIPPKYEKDVLRVANQCLIHKTIEYKPEIRIELGN